MKRQVVGTAEIAERLSTLVTGSSKPVFTGYHRAASVLSYFDPSKVKPLGRSSPDDFKAFLRDCTVDTSAERPKWSLRDDVRKAVLASERDVKYLKAALRANLPLPEDPTQKVIELVLSGKKLSLPSGLDASRDVIRVLDWFSGIFELDEEKAIFWRRQRLEEFLKPFHVLADHFYGRQDELRHLSDYVEVLEPSSKVESIKRVVRSKLGFEERPPLFVMGPGGMGKSTLIARFILDHFESRKLRVVFLDADRATLDFDEPLSLAAEAAYQLSLQVEDSRPFVSFEQDCRQQLNELAFNPKRRKESRPTPLYALAKLLENLSTPLRLLIVVDSFEEAQFARGNNVEDLLRLLSQLQMTLPNVRTVIAGRVTLQNLQRRCLELKPLNFEAASSFLRRRGIEDSSLIEQVFSAVGGLPLSLRLASFVIKETGAKPSDLTPAMRGLLVNKVSDAEKQAHLYRRILQHIHDEDIRRLAHPGLVLRRITPEIIESVLAVPCDVKVKDSEHAKNLFERFSQESALVTMDADGSLRHRPELRRLILRQMMRDKEKVLEDISRAAIAYYERNSQDVIGLSELIYHRLLLGNTDFNPKLLFDERVRTSVLSGMEEYGLPARRYISAVLNVGDSFDNNTSSDTATAEFELGNQVEDFLGRGMWDDAFYLLQREPRRTEFSPLHVYDARVHERKADEGGPLKRLHMEAAKMAIDRALSIHNDYQSVKYEHRSVESEVRAHGSTEYVELIWIRARLQRKLRFISTFEDFRTEFRSLAPVAGDHRVMEIIAERLRLLNRENYPNSEKASYLQTVSRYLSGLDLFQMGRQAESLTRVAGEMAFIDPNMSGTLLKNLTYLPSMASRFKEAALDWIQDHLDSGDGRWHAELQNLAQAIKSSDISAIDKLARERSSYTLLLRTVTTLLSSVDASPSFIPR